MALVCLVHRTVGKMMEDLNLYVNVGICSRRCYIGSLVESAFTMPTCEATTATSSYFYLTLFAISKLSLVVGTFDALCLCKSRNEGPINP